MKFLIRYLLIGAGILAVILGVLGIFLPLIPTTPFLLLAAACFVRSSERLYSRLMETKWLGSYIRDYREGRRISLKARLLTLTVLWVTMFATFYFAVESARLRVLLSLTALAVTIYLLSLNGRKSKAVETPISPGPRKPARD